MYSKIINPKTNRYVNINSKLGKSILKKYIGGSIKLKYEPTPKLDFLKKIPSEDKHLPHYIENSKCKPIRYKLGYNIQTGDIRSTLTLLDNIRLFYNNVFNIRKNVVDRKTGSKDYVYDNATRCHIFLNKDTGTPEKFKQKIDGFRRSSEKLLVDLRAKINKINQEIFDPIKTINNISTQPQWQTEPITMYIKSMDLKNFIIKVDQQCTLIIETLERNVKQLLDSVAEIETILEKLFNFSWTQGDSKETLIGMFYQLNNNLDREFQTFREATYSYVNTLNEDFIIENLSIYMENLNDISVNKLSVEQVVKILDL